jgi:hypothetical protein
MDSSSDRPHQQEVQSYLPRKRQRPETLRQLPGTEQGLGKNLVSSSLDLKDSGVTSQSMYFTKLDLLNTYHLIQIKEDNTYRMHF